MHIMQQSQHPHDSRSRPPIPSVCRPAGLNIFLQSREKICKFVPRYETRI